MITESDGTRVVKSSNVVGATRSKKLFGQYNIGLVGILFVAPIIVLICLFLIYPIGESFYYSFSSWNGASSRFVGLGNYVQLFSSPVFGRVILNNLLILLSIPLWVVIPLMVAVLIHQEVKGWKFFRFALFAPTALSWAVVAVVWQFIFSYHGTLNELLSLLGINGLDWLDHGSTALVAIIITIIWANLGSSMIIYLAGLSAISPEVLEAARIDGARGWNLFRFIIIPLLKRYIEFVTVLSIIMAFTGLFSLIFVMTNGGPGFDTTTLEYFVYTDAFQNLNYGQASAVGVILFVVVFGISILQMRTFRTNG